MNSLTFFIWHYPNFQGTVFWTTYHVGQYMTDSFSIEPFSSINGHFAGMQRFSCDYGIRALRSWAVSLLFENLRIFSASLAFRNDSLHGMLECKYHQCIDTMIQFIAAYVYRVKGYENEVMLTGISTSSGLVDSLCSQRRLNRYIDERPACLAERYKHFGWRRKCYSEMNSKLGSQQGVFTPFGVPVSWHDKRFTISRLRCNHNDHFNIFEECFQIDISGEKHYNKGDFIGHGTSAENQKVTGEAQKAVASLWQMQAESLHLMWLARFSQFRLTAQAW